VRVGDLFMSLMRTCQLCGANSFDYLTDLQRHGQKLATDPAERMLWNDRETPRGSSASPIPRRVRINHSWPKTPNVNQNLSHLDRCQSKTGEF